MTLPLIWTAVAASLLATAVFAAATALGLLRRLAALARSQEAADRRLTQLTVELRRLERTVEDGPRRERSGAAALGSGPLIPLISVPDLGRDEGGDAAAELAAKHVEVWSLVEAGRPSEEIARETGRSLAQVELIAGLYRQSLAAQSRGSHDEQ